MVFSRGVRKIESTTTNQSTSNFAVDSSYQVDFVVFWHGSEALMNRRWCRIGYLYKQVENYDWPIRHSECVNWDKIISGYDTILILMWHFTFIDLLILVNLCCLALMSKTTSLTHVFEKVPSAKWPHKLGEDILCLSNC